MDCKTGFVHTPNGLSIDKDTEAVLIYTFDWCNWLDEEDSIVTAEYEVTARANDPDPLIIESQGVAEMKTFVELSNGQEGKTYTVYCTITTTGGLVDRRNFRVRVLARSA